MGRMVARLAWKRLTFHRVEFEAAVTFYPKMQIVRGEIIDVTDSLG